MRRAVFATVLVLVSAISASFTVLLSVKYFPVLGPTIGVQPSVFAPTNTGELPTLAPVVKKVIPAVVGIKTTTRVEEGDGEIREVFGAGSGFIIDSHGFVVTAQHVIAKTQLIEIIFNDEELAPAKVVGSDDTFDIALLKIVSDKTDFPAVPFGDSDEVEIGNFVFAIGNPFGDFLNSVTAGIISAKRWAITVPTLEGEQARVQISYFQTDASINPGNSGGPLFNFRGEVVGLNTVIFSMSRGSVGIGFAIPSNLVKFAASEFRDHRCFRRGWTGARGPVITSRNVSSLRAPIDHGLFINNVFPNSTAEKSGLRVGDVILSWNGKEIRTTADAEMALLLSPVGSIVKMKVFRDGRIMEFSVEIKQAGRCN